MPARLNLSLLSSSFLHRDADCPLYVVPRYRLARFVLQKRAAGIYLSAIGGSTRQGLFRSSAHILNIVSDYDMWVG